MLKLELWIWTSEYKVMGFVEIAFGVDEMKKRLGQMIDISAFEEWEEEEDLAKG